MNISPEQHEENRKVLEEVKTYQGTSEGLDVAGGRASIDDIQNEKKIVMELHTEIRPLLYGIDPSMVAEGKVDSSDPVRDILQHYIETYKGDPFVMIELLSIITEELKRSNPEEMVADPAKQELYRISAKRSLETVKALFRDYFPDAYEA